MVVEVKSQTVIFGVRIPTSKTEYKSPGRKTKHTRTRERVLPVGDDIDQVDIIGQNMLTVLFPFLARVNSGSRSVHGNVGVSENGAWVLQDTKEYFSIPRSWPTQEATVTVGIPGILARRHVIKRVQ